ncbi:acyltransferase [Sphaerisporangium sp. TRM90804]|uniref:acyltransferase family protein n=1 Tax=Sphaerisporangium sp. TRM90804 TaxID=3031113 RepID=UPI00244C2330|nr:acyltransferase [Sphaerisporangium sp. TRM90804]MDH2427905.1 acyltransferase [Sphaerisporangium sp. TRM90804]
MCKSYARRLRLAETITERRADGVQEPPPIGDHQRALDGLRAVAALAVLALHVAATTGQAYQESLFGRLLARGDVGVPIFFILSGLLLYRPWAAALLTGEPGPRVRVYLLRRALRVLPAYWAVVTAALLFFSPEHTRSPWTWAQWFLLLPVYDPDPWWQGSGPEGLYQMWTLAIEVAFYLTLPVMAWLIARYARRGGADAGTRARRALAALGALTALSALYLLVVYVPRWNPQAGALLPRYWVWFCPGMALALVIAWAHAERGADGPVRRFCRTVAASWGTCWLIAAVVYAMASTELTGPRVLGVDTFWSAFFRTVLYTVVAVFLVAPVALAPGSSTPAGRVLGGAVLGFLGRISYSVFLWHVFVIAVVYRTLGWEQRTGGFWPVLAAVVLITVVVAAASHRVVEEPFRAIGRALPVRGRAGD